MNGWSGRHNLVPGSVGGSLLSAGALQSSCGTIKTLQVEANGKACGGKKQVYISLDFPEGKSCGPPLHHNLP
jgi:hypothetical protein